jgi:hypothetical protein
MRLQLRLLPRFPCPLRSVTLFPGALPDIVHEGRLFEGVSVP